MPIANFAAEIVGIIIVAQSQDTDGTLESRFLRRIGITILTENPINDFRKRGGQFLGKY